VRSKWPRKVLERIVSRRDAETTGGERKKQQPFQAFSHGCPRVAGAALGNPGLRDAIPLGLLTEKE